MEIITANKALQNWVDIEEVYYQLLVYNANKDQFKAIETLNKEFDDIKNKLEEYLKTQILNDNSHLFSAYENIMFDYIDPKDFTDKDVISQIRNEMYSDHLKKNNITHKTEYGFTKWFNDYIEKENDYRINSVERYFGKEFCICPKFSMFLNFNYTNTLDYYHQMSNQEIVISIHGRLAEHIDNPIIFGYGDEIDENYKMLEKKSIGKNYVLKNMKSANYSKTNNYNRVLNFINSDLYQIIILGHSCGNSDRTLLNKLFEHPNCVSIKPYYYVDKDGKSDYFDKYINISRNFNDKNHLREKVVNERYCGRMPQINN